MKLKTKEFKYSVFSGIPARNLPKLQAHCKMLGIECVFSHNITVLATGEQEALVTVGTNTKNKFDLYTLLDQFR